MKKGYLIMAAIASVALVSCSNEEFVGEPQNSPEGGGAISFDLMTPALTRGEITGQEAATALGNQFIVWGEKNETDGTAASNANLVFKNYKVEWTDNSAYTTTSNTKNWEYVGLTPYAETYVSPSINPTVQTIKYWDYSASSYTFTAVSAKQTDISGGLVKITKTQSGTTVYDKGYTIDVKANADIDKIFVADRNQPTLGSGTDRTAINTRGGNVQMKFRNFTSKIRFGIYENIHGYKVKITNVHYNNADHTTSFGVDGKFLTAGANTQFTVTYENPSNKAVVDVKSGTTPSSRGYFETAPAAEVTSGTPSPQIIVPILSADYIGTTPTTATFDRTEKVTSPASETPGVYTTILPFTSNDANILLTIDYKLISEDTNEEITITGKTAKIPAAYCQWKSNYAYSYLFKITDNDLYPITFDAVQITDENGNAEYITTVTEPSITTYAKASAVTTNGDYKDGEKIYATVMDGSSLATLDATNMKLYTVSTSDATNFPITEASVAEALIEGPTWTAAQAALKKITCTASAFTYGKTVVAPDGSTLTMDANNYVVADFTGAKTQINDTPEYGPTYYAIVYQKTAATYTTDGGKNDYTNDSFTAAGTLYTNAECTTVAESWTSGTTYYKRTGVSNKGTYAVKIVKVVP